MQAGIWLRGPSVSIQPIQKEKIRDSKENIAGRLLFSLSLGITVFSGDLDLEFFICVIKIRMIERHKVLHDGYWK